MEVTRRQDDWLGELGRPRHLAVASPDRVPPFLVVPTQDPELTAILIAPFARRRRGPTPEERAMAQAVSGYLSSRPTRPFWIEAQTGSAAPATIGEAQIRRRLHDNACFNVVRRS